MKNISALSLFVAGVCLSMSAFAHTGLHNTSGFMAGFSHPFSGMDHLLAMVAVGLWAAQLGGRATWLVPTAFVSMMTMGGALGFAGVSAPFVETGIIVSVFFMGLLIAAAITMPLIASMMLVTVFALFHGHAHGAEMPIAMNSFSYATGFIFSTALLHIIGIVLGQSLRNFNADKTMRIAGALIALSGVYLVMAS